MHNGFSEKQIREIIYTELDKNPDLEYYINNPYLDELLTLLIDGISKAIVKNSNKVIDDINRDIRLQSRIGI